MEPLPADIPAVVLDQSSLLGFHVLGSSPDRLSRLFGLSPASYLETFRKREKKKTRTTSTAWSERTNFIAKKKRERQSCFEFSCFHKSSKAEFLAGAFFKGPFSSSTLPDWPLFHLCKHQGPSRLRPAPAERPEPSLESGKEREKSGFRVC